MSQPSLDHELEVAKRNVNLNLLRTFLCRILVA